MKSRQIRVTGRVQGVGYRDALRREALRLGIRGWVRNRRDGSVEALLQGEPGPLEELVAWARRGPPLAEVAQVEERTAPDGEHAGFEIRPSA
jgi:acylphosphatase